MGSNKHKHKSRKRKHYRSSDSSEKEYEKDKHKHHKKHHKDRKEKRSKPILVDEYDSSSSEDDVIIVTPPPPPKISHATPIKKNSKILSRVSPPPPPKISQSKSPTSTPQQKQQPPPPPSPPPQVSHQNSSSDVSMSVEETNKLRIKLGLKPLDVVSDRSAAKHESREKKESYGGVDMGDFVHKPAENISSKSYSEKLKEKLQLRREKRALEEKLLKVKKLNEVDDSDDDDASKWVEKNRRIISEKEQAEKRAKEIDAMDEVFGIGELIEEETRIAKRRAYTSKDLKGLKVEHNMDSFKEERDVILTLKDKAILDEEDDTLVNVNILDDERYKKNIDRRRQKPGYNAYEDECLDIESMLEKKLLSKYDEEIEGEKRSSFTLGVDAQMMEEARKESIRNKLQQYAVGKRLENLSVTLQPASEYYTEQEIAFKFKKPKKKVRKIRKVKPLTADDLLSDLSSPLLPSVKNESVNNVGEADSRKAKPSTSVVAVEMEIKDEPYDEHYLMDIDGLSSPPCIDMNSIKIDINEEDDQDLQLALHRTRKLQQMAPFISSDEKADWTEVDKDSSEIVTGGSIVLNETAEFCRTLGDIPTYGQAGNREEDTQELLDFERELKVDKVRKEDLDSLTSGWNEVAMDSTPVDIATYEAPILDAEPDISSGVAGALRMAISKGYIQTETEKRPSAASRTAHLQAQNYSIEDKAHSLEDDKHARRERYSGPTSEFKEKEGYKPNVKLEYIDDEGHLLCAKEAFRYLSHKFHGKGPGKNKIEKRMKKGEQEALMKQMSSTDTPLSTLKMLQQKQKETQSPFVVLSGSKHGHSTTIAK